MRSGRASSTLPRGRGQRRAHVRPREPRTSRANAGLARPARIVLDVATPLGQGAASPRAVVGTLQRAEPARRAGRAPRRRRAARGRGRGARGRCRRRAGRMQRSAAATEPLVVVDYAHTARRARQGRCSALRPAVARRRRARVRVRLRRRPRPGQARRRWAASRRRSPTASSSPATTRAARIRRAIIDADRCGRRDAASPRAGRRARPPRRDRAALVDARARGDVVLIAGKGHETYQEIATASATPFSRRREAASHARRMEWGDDARYGRDRRHARSDGRAVGAPASRSCGVTHGHPHAARAAISSSRSKGDTSTATTSSRERSRRARRRPWSRTIARRRPPARGSRWHDTRLAAARPRSPRTGARAFALPLVAVVGSNGKTTTKDMLAVDRSASALSATTRCSPPRQLQQRRSACR